MQIVVMMGRSYPTVISATDWLDAGGWSAICPVVHGCCSGDSRLLSQTQKNTIQCHIIGKRRAHIKMDFSLWSRVGAGQLIGKENSIHLPTRSIGRYLTRWGFTLHKPVKRAYQQSLALLPASLQGEKPTIKQPAKAETTVFLQDILGFMRLEFLFCKVHFATNEHTRHQLRMR